MAFRKLMWLTPILVVFHNIEEYLTMTAFLTAHGLEIPAGLSKYTAEMAEHFSAALVIVTVMIFLITYIGSISKVNSAGRLLFFFTQVLLLLNAVQHIFGSIWLRAYTPGVITAIGLYLPVLSYLIIQAFRQDYVFNKNKV